MSIASKLIRDVLHEQKASGHAEGEIKVPKYGNDHTPNNHVDNKNMRVIKDPAKGLDQRNDKKPKADVGQARKEKGRDYRTIKPKVSEQRLLEETPNPIVQALNLRVVDNGRYLTFSNPQVRGEVYRMPWGKVRNAVSKFVVNDAVLSNPEKAASALYERLVSQPGAELASGERETMNLLANIGSPSVPPYKTAGGQEVLPDSFSFTPFEDRIAKMREIVENQQYDEIDGQPVDLYSASAVIQVYDALSPENRIKLSTMPVQEMIETSLKVIKRSSGVKEAAGGGTAQGEIKVPSYGSDDPSYSKKNRSKQPYADKNKGDPGMVKKTEKRSGKDGLMDANPAKVAGPDVGRGQIAEKKTLENLLGRELQLNIGE